MKKSSTGKRLSVLSGMTLTLAAVFLARLIQWQIVQSDMYRSMTDGRELYTVAGDAVRGEIFDVNGEPLAVNLTGRRIVFNRLYIKSSELNGIIERALDLAGKCGESWEDELPVIVDADGDFAFKGRGEAAADLRKRYDLPENADAAECMRALAERYGCEGMTGKKLRDVVSVRYNMERTDYSGEHPYIFAQNISERSMAVISEQMSDVRGVTVEAAAVRTYLNGTAAPHIVGITGLISQEEYEELRDKGYSYNDRVGKSGIEAAFEDTLRGTAGSRVYERDSDGSVRLVSEEAARPGNSIYLTIDAGLQAAAQKALMEAVQQANDYAVQTGDESMGADCAGGAAVVLNVKDFSVLCAASYPGYDLERYYDDYEQLSNDSAAPLFDRAFAGALTPGSVFKPLVASAALQEGKITPDTRINCSGVYTKGGLRLWCMGFHGDQDMDHAMVDSCNVYFAEAGRLLGIEKLDSYALRCGLGVKTGVEIYESAGTLAGPELSKLTGTPWYPASVSPAAIGQSDNQFTPLQLAAYAAALANNGRRLKTHVVDRIVEYGSNRTIYRAEPEQADDMGVSRENLDAVRLAMLHAAESYAPLEGCSVSVAGKTGTAENGGSDHANFICFAPYDQPEIAVAVMIEHGAKSYTAVNAARKILDEYFLNGGRTPHRSHDP